MDNSQNAILDSRERRRERRRSFSIFFSIVFTIYSLLNFYIYVRLRSAVPNSSWFAAWFLPVFLFISLSYLVGQFLEYRKSTIFSDALTWTGSLWLAPMSWFVLAFALLDLVRLIFLIAGVHLLQGTAAIQATIGSISVVVFVLLVIGFFNARNIRVKPLKIKIDKPGKPLRIAAISDMHMGSLIGKRMVRQMVRKINSTKPDLVLMVGDQVDGNPHPVMQLDLGSELTKIESKYGVYAITGNHEYIGNAETACAYLEAHGVKMIRDSHVEVAGMYLIGREDSASKQFAGVERKSLEEIMAGLDKSKPMILLDHTPFHLEQAENNGIDLQLSGHTHHAQIWPWSFITKRVYEVSWGYKKKGNTHIYVSCGSGTWGPPVRLGNTPEIMNLSLEFGL